MGFWPFKATDEISEEKLSRRNQIKLEFLHKAREVEKKIAEGNPKVLARSYFMTVREFFTKLLSMKKGSTYEEILGKVEESRFKESLKPRIVHFLKVLPEIEYAGHEIGKPELKILLREFKNIIKEL
jgi:hypothetical protein